MGGKAAREAAFPAPCPLNPASSMHALVTGGGGFLGRYIVEALVVRGDRVRSLGRGAYPELEAAGVEVVRGDIRDNAALAKACAGIDCVFHAAALPGIGIDRDAYESVNRTGTELLLSECAALRRRAVRVHEQPQRRVCGATTSAAWMKRPPMISVGWNANRAFYSYTKACAEQAVLAANGDSFRTCALRPHLIWGPRRYASYSASARKSTGRAAATRGRRVRTLSTLLMSKMRPAAHLQAADALGKD